MKRYLFFILLALQGFIFSQTHVLTPNASYAQLVRIIGGDDVEVTSVIPKGQDVHHFEPSWKELDQYKKADLWVQLGGGLEKKISKVIPSDTQALVLNHNPSADPHFWMSFSHLRQHISSIKETLCTLHPDKKQEFETRFQACIEKLDAIEKKAHQKRQGSTQKAIGVSHDALGYFCKEMQLQQVALDHHGHDLAIKELQHVKEHLAEDEVQKIIYVYPHGKKQAEVIAQELGIQLVTFQPADDPIEALEQLVELVFDE